MIDGFVLLVIGGFLLLSALAFLAKVGFWMVLASKVAHPTQPAPTPPSSSGDGIKKFLGIVSAILGILSTSVGLVKECTPKQDSVPAYQAPPQPQPTYTSPPPSQPTYYEPPPQPTYSMTCCTSAGNCMMMDGAQAVGAPCMCFNAFGAVISGTVCN